MRRLDNTGQNYIPLRLPCKKEINQNYEPGMIFQCCRTECPGKTNDQIEQEKEKNFVNLLVEIIVSITLKEFYETGD